MESQARAQDILLAYDPDFTGFTSLSTMARPLEPVSALATAPTSTRFHGGTAYAGASALAVAPSSTGFLGGTADPDGYYDDFTTRLDRFVRAHPRLGGGPSSPLDWRAVVVALGPSFGRENDDSSSDGGSLPVGGGGLEFGSESDDGGPGGGGVSPPVDGGGAFAFGEHAVEVDGGGPFAFGEYVVEVDGGADGGFGDHVGYAGCGEGRGDQEPRMPRGEMDESEAESFSYGQGRPSILGYVVGM